MLPQDGEELASLSNPLVSVDQLTTSSAQLDGIPPELESSLRYAGARLTQTAGILLRIPQETIAQAIVLFYRFYVGPEGGSFWVNSLTDVSAAALYLTAKCSFTPISPRSLLNVYTLLVSPALPLQSGVDQLPDHDPDQYFLSDGSYRSMKYTLFQTETTLLRTTSFSTQVIPPHHLALTYLQTLGALPAQPTEKSQSLALRTVALLNTALFSPQLLYLTHQPGSLAVAAIYLAAREVGATVSNAEWWEVFDVDREQLGFLTVALLSCEEWARAEQLKWKDRACPLSLGDLKQEMQTLDHGAR